MKWALLFISYFGVPNDAWCKPHATAAAAPLNNSTSSITVLHSNTLDAIVAVFSFTAKTTECRCFAGNRVSLSVTKCQIVLRARFRSQSPVLKGLHCLGGARCLITHRLCERTYDCYFQLHLRTRSSAVTALGGQRHPC